MDRATIEQNLARAEAHVASGELHLTSQRKVVAELERDGHDIERAVSFLRTLEETQALHVADRDRLRAMLG